MSKRAFKANKKALVFVAIFSIIIGILFPADVSDSGGFFSSDLIFKSILIAIIGGSIVAVVSYLQYKKSNSHDSEE